MQIEQLVDDLLNMLASYKGKKLQPLYLAEVLLKLLFKDNPSEDDRRIFMYFDFEEYLKNFRTGLEEVIINLWKEMSTRGLLAVPPNDFHEEYENIKSTFATNEYDEMEYGTGAGVWVPYFPNENNPAFYIMVPEFLNPPLAG